MIPKDSYRTQNVSCCGTCQHSVNVYGIVGSICGFGEKIHADSFQEDLEKERYKYLRDGANYFDEGDFINQWIEGRWVHDDCICDEYKKYRQDPIA